MEGEFKVRLVDAEEKSVAEVEEQLLKQHEESTNATSETSDTVETTSVPDTVETIITEDNSPTIVDDIDKSNSVIYFTSDDEFIKLFDWSSKDVKNSTGITYIYHAGKKIVKCRTHIDIIECGKHKCTPITIRHEMFHILGFCHQENEKNTILKSKSIVITERDKEMISLPNNTTWW